ncbi:MAG: N-acetylmuramoyl-L-alanine amidase [Myxococcota bacterium]
MFEFSWFMLTQSASLLAFTPTADHGHAFDPGCGLEPPEQAALAPAIPQKQGRTSAPAFDAPFMVRTQPDHHFHSQIGGPGILAGKTVYVSAGHGFVNTGVGWRAQRGNTNGIVEDLVSIEAINQYLIPYLHGMGAYVVTVREPDFGTQMLIIDDPDAVVEGNPSEGPGNGPGWGPVTLPIASDAVAPFQSGNARSLVAAAAESGGLVYAANVPADGYYNVYISFTQGPDRAPDAHWVVRHSGGQSHFRIDQRRHGSTWILLGRFHFEAGADSEASAVVVLDDSSEPGSVVSADAVRLGGGMALHDRGDGPNDRPMAEQCARYYTQWNGAPPSVFDPSASDSNDDVSARSRFAAWEHEPGEDAVDVAWHTNAPNPGRGTETYTYGDSAPPGPLENFSGVAGSRQLQDAIHTELIDDLRAEVDPGWIDRGRFTAYFGEINPSHNPQMPAVLLELGFHSTPEDAAHLREPDFRRVASRSIAQGIAAYFADQDGIPLVLPPEPPRTIWLHNDGQGGLVAQWQEPAAAPGGGDPPTSYVVQVSTNGYGFDEGTSTSDTTLTLDGLWAGDVRYVRILAVNDGGRSLPSAVVGAAVAPSGTASVLVVDGFDRLDGGLLPSDDLSAYDLGLVDRMRLNQMNDFGYAPRHAEAIDGAGFSFDGTTDDGIESGTVALTGYQAVDWFSGTDSVGDEPLSSLARDALADYLDQGGRLLISGAELGWAMDEFGTPDEQDFFRQRLHASYVADDAEVDDAEPASGELFEGIGEFSFADPTVYYPEYPDVLAAEPGGSLALVYRDGFESGAAVAWAENDELGVLLGFPFETIDGAQTRIELMSAVLDLFGVVEPEGEPEGDTDGNDSTGSADSTGDLPGGTGAGESPTGSEGSQGTDSGGQADGGDQGCSCRSSPGPRAAMLPLLLALGALRRRRSTR